MIFWLDVKYGLIPESTIGIENQRMNYSLPGVNVLNRVL